MLGRFNRDEPSPFFARKNADKDDLDDRDEPPTRSRGGLPFGGLTRASTTGPTTSGSSPWASSTATATMGSFGSFALPSAPGTPNEKRPAFGRGESRLAHLMPKDSSEELTPAKNEPLRSEAAKSWRARPRTETDPFDDESVQGGSAALGGQDISPIAKQRRAPGYGTPSRKVSSDLGATDMSGFRDAPQALGTQTPYGRQQARAEFESPTETNPYASPADDRGREEDNSSVGSAALHHLRLGGLGGVPEPSAGAFASLSRGFSSAPFDHPDRSATSSAAGNKGFPSLSTLGGLGSLGGWPTSTNAIGTPDRERSFQSAFGSSIFPPIDSMQSPGGLGSLGGFNAVGGLAGSSTIGRGSKLGSLFPAAMQAQMHSGENDHQEEQRSGSAFGTIGRSAFGPPRETDSPLRSGRAIFDDLLPPTDFRSGSFTTGEQQPLGTPQGGASVFPSISGQGQTPAESGSASGPMDQNQQRTMVMPDRMRWVYLDPQGQVQGPWSGLEMHDWYKASFFTPNLSVKKLEDAEFEPLGQLIRRIGNSREPFLVPQIGVPHGPAAPATLFAPVVPAAQTGAVQPPFAGAFPSFGTTLTAEQQNNLERRKQEEQFLMARQREFLAQQQVNMKQMQMQGGLPSALHHHSSAHSLQSQPSFGSISSPIGQMLPQQISTTASGFFDAPRPTVGPANMNMPPDFFREDEIARLTLQDRAQSFGAPAPPQRGQLPPMFQQPQIQPVGPPSAQQLQNENDPGAFRARLQEFEQLRAQHDAEQAAANAVPVTEPIGPPQHRQQPKPVEEKPEPAPAPVEVKEEPPKKVKAEKTMTLTEQIQKAAAEKPSALQPESPWTKVPQGLPMPFPPAPPQSITPLPAPSAQRTQSSTLPDTLHAGTRSRSETPEHPVLTPSVAPWAKEPVEAPKGPSLKEIQEAEAKKAAKIEEIAAAARRVALEQEIRNASAAAAKEAGLPSTSNWASSSPVTPAATTASPWAKSSAAVPAAKPSGSAKTKTLAEIQKEEEARKAKLAAAAAAAAAAPALPVAGGKRYADLASKPTLPAMGSAWSTVGAGGKVKAPPAPPAALAVRSASTAAVPTMARVVRPTVADRTATSAASLATQNGVSAAQNEFNKWAKSALSKGLNSEINGMFLSADMLQCDLVPKTNISIVDEFVQMLYGFPTEAGIIADCVYANSELMDGRRFGEEFIRRKKLAEKGVVELANTGATGFSTAGGNSSTVGGWSEVAKKGPPKVEEPLSAPGFKVVPGKKKGRK